MANEFELSPKELKRQADALLAAADAAEKAAEREPAARSAKKSTRKKGEIGRASCRERVFGLV